MSELTGLYALWYREFKVFLSEKSRIISSLVSPLMWLVIFGSGLGSALGEGSTGSFGGVAYTTFIYPGILVMAILFSTVFFGLYIILDKRVDFLKEVFVSPVSRTTIFFGKVLGGSTDGIIQVLILLALGGFFGMHYTPFNVVASLLILIVLAISTVSLGLVIGAFMSSPEGFGLISGFLIFPLFFLSGALFPVSTLPSWLAIFVRINPLSYGVDALRDVLLGISGFGLALDVAVMLSFMTIMIVIGTWSFRRMKL